MSDEPQLAELKPCPFCGGEAEIAKHYKDEIWRLFHRCSAVGYMEIGWRESREALADRWNKRTCT